MRLAIFALPLVLAAGQVSAKHDRHHRSVPRISGEFRLDKAASEQAASSPKPVAASIQPGAAPQSARPRVRIVLPSPFSQ